MKKLLLLAFVSTLLVSLVLRLLLVLNYNFPFTMDLGHDILDIRRIVFEKRPLLIGPPTSLPGLFHGPFWFYFNILPFVVGGGNPSYLVYWLIFWYLLSGVCIWYFIRKISSMFAFLSAYLYLLHPVLLFKSRFALNSNFMPVAAAFYFLFLVNFFQYPSRIKAFILGVLSGFILQVESGFGVMYLPFLVATFILYKAKARSFIYAAIGFVFTLVPQLIFEFRHGFLMTNSFIHELLGEGEALGDKMGLLDRFKSHLESYLEVIGHALPFSKETNYLLFVFALVFLLVNLRLGKVNKFLKRYFVTAAGFVVFTFILYMLYPFPLKGWFVNSLYVPILFLFALFVTQLASGRHLLSKFVATAFILSFTFGVISVFNRSYLSEKSLSHDPSVLRNELTAIDWVYKSAAGKPFKVFNYMPSVLDYPYQYLFWWHGERQFGYHPDTVSYLENVPSYIENNEAYFSQKRSVGEEYSTYLIIEPDHANPDRIDQWLNNFSGLCIKTSITFPWGTEVQERIVCPSPTSATTSAETST